MLTWISSRSLRRCWLAPALIVVVVTDGANAQIRTDGSLGPAAQTLAGPAHTVPHTIGRLAGNNLFHSFSVFNVDTNESAVFTGPPEIRNVIARVTGGTSTSIDGLVAVDISGANFYFFNPNGVVIRENAAFSVSGSIFLSTADSLRLADGGVFHADPAKSSVLTTADPSAFGFLSAAPAPITLTGPFLGLPVPPGKTFALVGGDITIQASEQFNAVIFAPGATVSLASVASAGDAVLGTGAVDLSGFDTLGSIRISGASVIDVGDAGSGSIYIRGGQLSLEPAGLLAQTFGDLDGGTIDIAVRGDMHASTDPVSDFISLIQAGSYGGFGRGASVNLQVGGKLTIADGSYLVSESIGPGAAGDIHIRAGAIEIRGLGAEIVNGAINIPLTGITADNHNVAAGPSLSITTGSLQLLNGGFVGTVNTGLGTGGALSIVANSLLATGANLPDTGKGVVTLSLSTETTGGAAGAMTITTRTLELGDGARISSSTGGFGPAGDLAINASEAVDITGGLSGIFTASAAGPFGNAGTLRVTAPVLRMSGGVIDSTTVGDGNAGTVDVSVGSLQLSAGAQIRSFSGGFDETQGGALVVGSGNAGRVQVVASGNATISGGVPGRPSGLLAETRGSGAGGDVSLQATVLRLADGATISSSSLGSGLAGNIDVRLSDSLEMQGGVIATRAVTSDGGNIGVFAPRLIQLTDSQITTSVQSGVGGGGNIFIDPQFVVLQNSQIIANAFGGPGGNINIVAGQLIADPATAITASSALGIDGSVNIDAPDTDVSAGLAVLPASFLDAASLLRAGCSGARAGLSSLVEVGRGGLPPDPDGYLPSLALGALAGTAVGASPADALPRATARVPGFGMVAALQRVDCAP